MMAQTLEQQLQAEFGGQFEDWRSRLVEAPVADALIGYGRRPLRDITAISIHHSAAGATVSPEVIDRFHKSTLGPNAPNRAPGIAYHLYLYLAPSPTLTPALSQREKERGREGSIWRVAYVGDINTVRWHTAQNNQHTVGICVAGNYAQADPPWEVIGLLQRSVAVVQAVLGRALEVRPHRAFANTATSCPGRLGEGAAWQAVAQAPLVSTPLVSTPLAFVLGFKIYAEAHPEIGQPVENEWYGQSGGQAVLVQRTTQGVLVYDPAQGVRYARWE